MVEEYKEALELVKRKFEIIGFYLIKDEDFYAEFIGDNNWKIVFEGERYIRPTYDIIIEKGEFNFSTRLLMNIFDNGKKRSLENRLNFIIEYKDKIFDETFPYKEKYDELNKIPY